MGLEKGTEVSQKSGWLEKKTTQKGEEMGDRHQMQFWGITYARELYENQINIDHKTTLDSAYDWHCVPQYKIEERPGNTGPCSQKDKDYDVIWSSGH